MTPLKCQLSALVVATAGSKKVCTTGRRVLLETSASRKVRTDSRQRSQRRLCNWNMEGGGGGGGGTSLEAVFFCHRLLWVSAHQDNNTPPILDCHYSLMSSRKSYSIAALIRYGWSRLHIARRGPGALSAPARLVESDQSSASSREDCVTQLLVNFQLKTKPIDNVSAFCLLNSII